MDHQIIPPFAGVMLVEYRDRLELRPYEWVREFVGLGRMNANELERPTGPLSGLIFDRLWKDKKIWVIVRWQRYEDGREEALNIEYLDPEASETQAKRAFDHMVRFANKSKEDLESLAKCFKASADDLEYIENRFPGLSRGAPNPKNLDEWDQYQARLKVLAGQQPKTVALLFRADETTNPGEKGKLEKEAVQAYFAELAHAWTEDEVMEWQRNNPINTEWICEFARVFKEPEKEMDPIKHELALSWLRKKYHLMTAEELSDAILVATGQRVMPGTLKKKRERLGLTTKRPTGPRPNEEQGQ